MAVVDLSHTLRPGMPVFPGSPQFRCETIGVIADDGFNEVMLSMAGHTGTHLDAPAHMLPGGATLEYLAPDAFIGPGMVMDFSRLEGREITLPMVRAHEDELARAEFALIRTGWSRYWGQEAYFGPYPCLSPEAAGFLCGCNLKGLGSDTASPDPLGSASNPVHHLLFSADMVCVENLTNLEALPPGGFIFAALPLKIANGDGSPVRAVALVE